MKFETYVHKMILNHQLNFYKDPCKDACAQGENARTCDALQRFRSDSEKNKEMRFIHFFKPGQNIMSLLKQNIQILPPLLTD